MAGARDAVVRQVGRAQEKNLRLVLKAKARVWDDSASLVVQNASRRVPFAYRTHTNHAAHPDMKKPTGGTVGWR